MEGEDFLSEPYSFGVCRSYNFTTTAHCDVFTTKDKEIHVSVRKRGNWVTVIIPDIMDTVLQVTGNLVVDPFLPSELLGSNPRVRLFGCIVRNCFFRGGRSELEPGMIRMEIDGTIKIKPVCKEDNDFRYDFRGNLLEGDKVGSTTTQFTYVIDDGHKFDNIN